MGREVRENGSEGDVRKKEREVMRKEVKGAWGVKRGRGREGKLIPPGPVSTM